MVASSRTICGCEIVFGFVIIPIEMQQSASASLISHQQHPSTSSKACVSLIDEMINTNNPLIGLPNHAAKRPAMPFCIYMKFICFILGTLSFTRTDININLGKTCYSICTKPLLPRLPLTISSSAAASSIIT